jgi:ribonuclease P protein subunit POP4
MSISIKDEFIGKELQVVKTKNRSLLGLQGKILDETKQSFKLLVNRKGFREHKIVFKHDNTFIINGKVFEGDKLSKRPEERIKAKE